MAGPILIVGFSPNDKVPGAYGEVVYGVSGQSAASVPLLCLLVGLKITAGNLTPDTEIRQFFSKTDADTMWGKAAEGAWMAYDAIDAAPAAPLYGCAPTAAGGAVQGTATITIAGSWSTSGQIIYRVAGKPVPVTINANDTPTTAAQSIVSAIQGALQGRLPVTAANVAGVVTATAVTGGIRSNQILIFQDTSGAPAGLTSTLAGGTAVTGGGVPLSTGSGQETYTNLLSTLLTSQFDRIALAANDTVSAGAWKTQIDSQAAAPINILQHVVMASNSTYSTAQTLAGSSNLNDPRFQVLWCLNAETGPWRIAAAFAAMRTVAETADPDAAYNNTVIPTMAPMSQKADWPSHAQLVTALNNGVTPITSNGSQSYVVRSVTTKSTTGGNPDYSTSDTGQASVPDFVFKDLRLYWTSVFAPANPRVQDDPLPQQRNPPSGVAYPLLWTAQVNKKLNDYSLGNLAGGTGTGAVVPPITLQPLAGDVTSSYDPIGKRIMSAITVRPAPNNAQAGISVRQAS